MIFHVFDIEADGLLDKATKIHCLSYQKYDNATFIEKGTLTDYDEIREFLSSDKIIVGHNIIMYDIPLIKKILNFTIESKLVDTLGISYYLNPFRDIHGLDSYGKEVGVLKPKVEDWENQPIEVYINRCEEDVEINSRVFIKFFRKLMDIYDNDLDFAMVFVNYLNFKLDCLREQEEIGITLNRELNNKYLEDTSKALEDKRVILQKLMPKELGNIIKTRPLKMFKADKTLSKKGLEWLSYLKENNLPPTSVEVRELPNPGSIPQLKKWLFKFGWNPITFKESTAKTENKVKKRIPQISLPFGQGICPSVKALYPLEPGLEELENYFMIRHRKGVFDGYRKSVDDSGKVYASAGGFTKTLRLTHRKPIANLPKPSVYYGSEIREVLTVPDDSYIMIGSDISGLEDSTKQHYIYPYDPEYVDQMRVQGFDPHIDIGVLAGLITKREEEFYKLADTQETLTEEETFLLANLKKKRGVAKQANFAATYGAFPPKIAEVAKIPLEEAENLYDTYWERNFAILKVAKSATVKHIKGQTWIRNPISGFWLFLTSDKDRFSAINQNSGVFVFDMWLRIVRKELNKLGIMVCLQYHDELLLYCKKELKDEVFFILKDSMRKVNDTLKLNVEINISIDIGSNYKECH